MISKERITENLKQIRENIDQACERSGRSNESVRLIAVTKTVDAATIKSLLELGQADLAESRAQDLREKLEALAALIPPRLEPPGAAMDGRPVQPRWHMIGHLQRNKVKPVLKHIDVVHSVDSLRLAEEINTNAARLGLNHKVRVLIQVNTSQEKQKYGLAVGAVNALTEQIVSLPNIEVCGLMTMAPLTDDMSVCRFCFMRLREIFDELVGRKIVGPAFTELSMGMSQDYAVAVECGATMVRVGTALFAE